MIARPALFSFDCFGTVLDWRSGLERACADTGHPLGDGMFEQIIDVQARIEAQAYRRYAEITAISLIEVLGMAPKQAEHIGANVGYWPLYSDSADALRQLQAHTAPIAVMTNSDLAHRTQVEQQLGFSADDWLCAEQTGVYKPDIAFWHALAARRGIELNQHWWHVSAYADYDLQSAAALELTTVLIERAHARHGPADLRFPDLAALALYCQQMPTT